MKLRALAQGLGLTRCAGGPLVRSSYHAGEELRRHICREKFGGSDQVGN